MGFCLEYTVAARQKDDFTFEMIVPHLHGCVATADTLDKVNKNTIEAVRSWFKNATDVPDDRDHCELPQKYQHFEWVWAVIGVWEKDVPKRLRKKYDELMSYRCGYSIHGCTNPIIHGSIETRLKKRLDNPDMPIDMINFF